MTTTYDNTDCDECGGECSLDWIPHDAPAVSKWETLARWKGWTEENYAITRGEQKAYTWSGACGADNLTEKDFRYIDEPAPEFASVEELILSTVAAR